MLHRWVSGWIPGLLFVVATVAFTSSASAEFVAYNDLSGSGAGSSSGNVTNLSLGQSGQLLNYDTGAATGVTLQVTGFDNAFRDEGFSVPDYINGDAATEFGTILNNNGYIRHNTVGQGYVEMRFTGLDPNKRYTVVLTGERGEPSYTNRNTKFTLTDVDLFTNSSSAGIPYSGSNWVEFNTGYNALNGYVARFSEIAPGVDGDMLVTAGVGTNSASGHWYLNSLKLVESGPVNAVIFSPDQISRVVGSANVDVTLSIPAGSNASSDVQVTLTSDTPTVAEVEGVCCSPYVATFAMGGPVQQNVSIDIGIAGSATISTSNDAGLIDTQLSITVTAGAVSFDPIALSASSFSSAPVTVALPPGSNDTRDVEVTVSSDHPTIAEPEGAVGGSVVLTFAAGAPAEQSITIETGPAGATTLRTTNDGGLGDAELPVQVTAPGETSFVAYNDVIYDAGSGHPALTSNVTTYNIGNGSPGPTGGLLIDKDTGATTGVTATLTQSGGVNWQPSASTGGSDCNLGTDARDVFDPATTVSLMGTVYYGSEGWWVDVTFTGLDPTRKYEFVTTANRNDTNYMARITRYTISGADAFVNDSTPGTTITNGGASTAFITGYNTANGYVARWVDIEPGADGTFKVRAEAGSSEYRAYAFDAFMLAEYLPLDSVLLSPGQIDTVVGSADVDVIVTIPPDSNETNDVQVTLTSDDPSVAEVLGASGSPHVVTFLTGGPTQQQLSIDIGAAGNAAITTTNDADLEDATLTVSVSQGQVSFDPDTLSASINTTIPVAVAITPGSNDTRDVQVTLSSADESIAAIQGAVNGSLALDFTAGSPAEQTVQLDIGQVGTTSISTTNDGGLADAVLPVDVADLSWIQVVVNPYADVDWVNFERHKANMHTHTTQSDGSLSPNQTITEYHDRGYTVLAITDHNRNTWPWQTYGQDPDALGMLAISGNEPSDHHHVNSYFIQYETNSTNLYQTIIEVGAAGGLLQINHPGRYSFTVQEYMDIYTTYDHVFGLEVINQAGRYNGDWSRAWPGNDIHLWDLILTELMPERPVWGLACDDMHNLGHLGRDWLTYVVSGAEQAESFNDPDRPWAEGFFSTTGPDEAVIRTALEEGQYYFSSLGPSPVAQRDVNQTPVIDSIAVDNVNGTITISATSGGQPLPSENYVWISQGNEIHEGPTINFRTTQGIVNYVRAELVGQGGTTYTNPFGIATVGPSLDVSPSQLERNAWIGDPLSDDVFTVTNVGPASLNYSITWNASWISSVDPAEGTSSGEPDTITVSYDLTGLTAGEYTDTITVSSLEAGNSPQTVSVTVNILTVAPDFDGDGDVDLQDYAFLQSCFGTLGPIFDPPECEAAELSGNSSIDATDLLRFMGCLNGPGIPADPACDD